MTGRILYGYRMEKGIAVVEQTEGLYVQKLFDDYINGIPQYKLLPELIQYTEKKPTAVANYQSQLYEDFIDKSKVCGRPLVSSANQ